MRRGSIRIPAARRFVFLLGKEEQKYSSPSRLRVPCMYRTVLFGRNIQDQVLYTALHCISCNISCSLPCAAQRSMQIKNIELFRIHHSSPTSILDILSTSRSYSIWHLSSRHKRSLFIMAQRYRMGPEELRALATGNIATLLVRICIYNRGPLLKNRVVKVLYSRASDWIQWIAPGTCQE